MKIYYPPRRETRLWRGKRFTIRHPALVSFIADRIFYGPSYLGIIR